MFTHRFGSLGLATVGLVAGLSVTALQGCDGDSPLGDLAEQCGLTCDEEAFLNGKFAISGNATVDAFFSASLDFSSAVNGVAVDIEGELRGLYALVGAEGGADFDAALKAKLSAYIDVDAGLEIVAQPARCEASLDVTAKAAAECDVNAKPGMVEVRCEGSCNVSAEAQADCQAAGALTCRGTPPDLKCSGTCEGACELEAAAACDGTCRGSCTAGGDTQNNFEGRCAGMCEGQCVVEAGASCSGRCSGTCEYKAPEGGCDASFEAKCDASVHAEAKCEGGCDGKATPPEVSAECEATVEAKAEASVQCYPPSLDIKYTFNAEAGADANLQAEFRAFLHTFKLRYAGLLAALARAEGLIDAGTNLGEAGVSAVTGLATELSAEGDFSAKFRAGCAIKMLPTAGELVVGATQKLSAQVQAAGQVTAALK